MQCLDIPVHALLLPFHSWLAEERGAIIRALCPVAGEGAVGAPGKRSRHVEDFYDTFGC